MSIVVGTLIYESALSVLILSDKCFWKVHSSEITKYSSQTSGRMEILSPAKDINRKAKAFKVDITPENVFGLKNLTIFLNKLMTVLKPKIDARNGSIL